MKNAVVFALFCAVPVLGYAGTWPQEQNQTSAAVRQLAEQSAPALSKIFTNEDLRADTPFVLLVLHDGGSDRTLATLRTLQRPQTQALAAWTSSAAVQTLDGRDPANRERHAYLIQKHGGRLPILALVQMTGSGPGAVWYSTAALPSSESQLSGELSAAYAATIQAAAEAESNAATYFPTSNAGPIARTVPNYDGDRRPFFNPQVDIKTPDTFDTNVTGGLNSQSQRAIMIGGSSLGGLFCAGCLGLGICVAVGLIGSAVLRGFAATGPPGASVKRTRRQVKPNEDKTQ